MEDLASWTAVVKLVSAVTEAAKPYWRYLPFWGPVDFPSVGRQFTRDELISMSSLLVIDDEKIDLIDDLEQAGFRVKYAPDLDDRLSDQIEQGEYDLILLDFNGVGAKYGHEQGLSALRQIKAINPFVLIIGFTSRSLTHRHKDFFKLTDHTLGKDEGIFDSIERIVMTLRKAFDLHEVWSHLLAKSGVSAGSSVDNRWKKSLLMSMRSAEPGRALKAELLGRTAGPRAGAMLSRMTDRLVQVLSAIER